LARVRRAAQESDRNNCNRAGSKDFKFVDQIRRAANSACANIAEGFGRYQHKEFSQFLSIAKGSLTEVQDHVLAGEAMGYWDATTARTLDDAAGKAIGLTSGLIRHLRSTKAPEPRS
jgi:four helix bundle protein